MGVQIMEDWVPYKQTESLFQAMGVSTACLDEFHIALVP